MVNHMLARLALLTIGCGSAAARSRSCNAVSNFACAVTDASEAGLKLGGVLIDLSGVCAEASLLECVLNCVANKY